MLKDRLRYEDGSSPLTRGKLCDRVLDAGVHRLIPAHAGKTVTTLLQPCYGWAHPRSRGENRVLVGGDQGRAGSSPLTRGKPTARYRRN